MAWHGFGRTILFGALAAGVWPIAALVLHPIWSTADALALYLVAVAAVYVAGLGQSPRRALGSGLLTVVLGAGVLLLSPGLATSIAGAALLVGIGRLRLFGASRPARTLVLEAGTLGAGLFLAQAVASPAPLHVALAIWSFFLAQSLYFLAADLELRREPTDGLDPFDLAAARAEALMTETHPTEATS